MSPHTDLDKLGRENQEKGAGKGNLQVTPKELWSNVQWHLWRWVQILTKRANEFAFKRDNVWSTLALRCCSPSLSHPHDWDHLSLNRNSLLTHFLGFNLTWGCLGLNSSIIWPRYSVSFQCLTESQSITQVLIVELQPSSLLMNLCPRICWAHHPGALPKYPAQYLGLRHNTSPKLPLAFLHIWALSPKFLLLCSVYPLGHPTTSSWTLFWFFGTVIKRLLDPILARLHLYC